MNPVGQNWGPEIFYRRLQSIVDDYGRHEARLQILRSFLYPAQLEAAPEVKIAEWIQACEKAGLILRYEVCGRNFVEIRKFGQRLRLMRSRFPSPDQDSGPCPCCGKDLTKPGAPAEPQPGQKEYLLSGMPASQQGTELDALAIEIYELYPNKVGKPRALKAIAEAIRKVGPTQLRNATAAFAALWKGQPSLQYCPHPATWFRDERYNDNPSSWTKPKAPVGGNTPSRNDNTANSGRVDDYR